MCFNLESYVHHFQKRPVCKRKLNVDKFGRWTWFSAFYSNEDLTFYFYENYLVKADFFDYSFYIYFIREYDKYKPINGAKRNYKE